MAGQPHDPHIRPMLRTAPLRMFATALGLTLFAASGARADCTVTATGLQAQALEVLRKGWPDRSFAPGDGTDTIRAGEAELGLQNLHARLCLSDLPDADRRAMIESHFSAIMQQVIEMERDTALDWASVSPRLRLQIVDDNYGGPGLSATLLQRRLAPGLLKVVVVNGASAMRYVTREQAGEWKQDEERIFEIAQGNLDAHVGEPQLQGRIDQPDPFLASAALDSYDAARLLLPRVRTEAASMLGDPFMAAVPNRDFLIMWSASNSADFQDMARTNVWADYAAQPSPLSPKVYRVWADGRIELAPPARAGSAPAGKP